MISTEVIMFCILSAVNQYLDSLP